MRTRFTLVISLIILFAMLAFVSSGLAQEANCDAIMQTAFEQLDQSCSTFPGSAACFGSSATASLIGNPVDGFKKTGDQLPLSDIKTVNTLVQNNQWGLAMLQVHANIPLQLSEQGVKFVLTGDVQIENMVDQATSFTPVPSILVTPLVAANLRSSPNTDARVLVNATVGTELTADGKSSDGKWLRVLSDGQVAWISRQIVAEKEGQIDTLPIITSNTRTLMQSFHLTTNDVSNCSSAPPSMLVIQSPAGVNTNITVNGSDIRFEGTVILQATPNKVMQFIVLKGAGNISGISIPSGFTLNIPLDPDGMSAGSATGFRPINDSERAFLTAVTSLMGSKVLYTAVTVPTQAEVNAILAQINGASGAQVVSGPAAGQAQCNRFKPTSPLSGMPLGVSPFFWDAAPGATSYRINLFSDGGLVNSVETNASSTTFQIDTNSFGNGSNFAWSVDALVNGQLACSSGRVSVVRDAFAQVVNNGNSNNGSGPVPTACSWQGC